MKFYEYLLLILAYIFSNVTGKEMCISYQCLQGPNDFVENDWIVGQGSLKGAQTEKELPGVFNGTGIKGSNITFFDLSKEDTLTYLINTGEKAPAYMYIKYYAHGDNSSESYFYVSPLKNGDYRNPEYYLEKSKDFKWREDFIELEPYFGGWVETGATKQRGAYLLIDTMIIVSGLKLDREGVMSLCPASRKKHGD